MYSIDKNSFVKLAKKGNLIPVYKEVVADMETPITTFYKLGNEPYSFLLESVTGGDRWGRYSILGREPKAVFSYKKEKLTIIEKDKIKESIPKGDPLYELQKFMARYKAVSYGKLPRFSGGAIGFLTYDSIKYFEKMPEIVKNDLVIPDSIYLITDTIIIFDNISNTIKILNSGFVDNQSPEASYEESIDKIESTLNLLRTTHAPIETTKEINLAYEFESPKFDESMNKAEFMKNVEISKEYILDGDIFQLVLSRRFSKKISVDPLDIYRALRLINPSPYMYYLNFGELKIAGTSPETLVSLEGAQIETKPIAGTRPRGESYEEDQKIIEGLLNDEKEIAEHVMLVDLARNDIGRVSKAGTVKVDKFKIIESYSHVSHIISIVRGIIEDDLTAYDLLRATFPAGTLSGAPKIRAMEIIEELEKINRGVYGGAIGYFSFTGNLDTAIAIRTFQFIKDRAYIQTGAGIVADSIPENEYQETVNKAQALVKAIAITEKSHNS